MSAVALHNLFEYDMLMLEERLSLLHLVGRLNRLL